MISAVLQLSYVLEKFGDSPCSSLMDLCTRGVHTGGDETLMPPLGRVESSEEVLTKMWTVSMGGMIPRLTTNTVLSKSSSITMCPVRRGNSRFLNYNHSNYDPACIKYQTKLFNRFLTTNYFLELSLFSFFLLIDWCIKSHLCLLTP